MKQIYFDYAATTPVAKPVLKEMNRIEKNVYGNASSVHSFGREAARELDHAREEVATFVGADFNEILFTSGATESNNLAMLGLLQSFKEKRPDQKIHIITSRIEHSSVKEVMEYILENDLAEVSFVEVDESGIVQADDVKNLIQENTALISIMYANNEIGTIQPIRDIGKVVKKINEDREKEIMKKKSAGEKLSFSAYDKLYFHTDAVQAANYLDCNVLRLHVDMLTLSSHKVYGPKGVGCLYLKEGTPLQSISFGGGQELSNRPGTHNLSGIVGFATALKRVEEGKEKETTRLYELQQFLITELAKLGGVLNGDVKKRLPNNINMSFKEVDGEILMLQLDQNGYAVSTGSACASGAVEPSHVLKAIGVGTTRLNSSIRISLGQGTTRAHCTKLVQSLQSILEN